MNKSTIRKIKEYIGYAGKAMIWASKKRKLIVLLVAAIGGVAASGVVDKTLSVVEIAYHIIE